ncbi:acetyltransferase [Streptomyces albus subsp. albus]|nr:acetyltransferase [Streptomyces albus subsp. albus]
MNEAQVNAYLRRIGADRPAAPDAGALRELHAHHLRAIPFENLSVHLGEDIVLETDALLDKLVRDRRGGFCYELNGAFAALLTALGYQVSLLAGRVYGPEGRLGPPFDHLALRVTPTAGDDTGAWLVDVGFGRHSLYPLRLDERGDQQDPGGVFRIADAPDGDLEVTRDGEPQYRLEQRPRVLPDFVPTCWWQRTSPESHFTRSVVCSLPTASGGRVTLSGDRLVTTEPGQDRREETLPDDAAVLDAYRGHFGIELDRVPRAPHRP